MRSGNIRVAVLGASGIGRIHVREFTRAGADVTAILGSSLDSAAQTARKLNQEFGLDMRPFADVSELLRCGVDAVSIATPWEWHWRHLQEALAQGLFIFCEKPLIWSSRLTPSEWQDCAAYLRHQASGKLALNTCNAALLRAWWAAHGRPDGARTFQFEYFTQGKHQGEDIGADLLAHGLSLLQEIHPTAPVRAVRKEIKTGQYRCWFTYGTIDCHFHFRENPSGEKKLSFAIDGETVTRFQHMEGGRYQVSLRNAGGEDLPVEDPFAVYIQDFLAGITSGRPFLCGLDTALRNNQLMAEILWAA